MLLDKISKSVNSDLIEVRSVSKSYGKVKVLHECSFVLKNNEIVVICGPSGSGKSSLVRCVNGLEEFETGTITFKNEKVNPRNKLINKLRSKMGMVFQSFDLFPHISVLENLAIGQKLVLKRTPDEANKKALNLLHRMGVGEQESKYPHQLSGGQQQRVAIGRALAMDPEVILFDEPTSALDPEMISEVLDVMTGLAEAGMAMIIVTHELGFARKIADRIIFMDGGKIIEDVPTEEFFTDPKSLRAKEFLSKMIRH